MKDKLTRIWGYVKFMIPDGFTFTVSACMFIFVYTLLNILTTTSGNFSRDILIGAGALAVIIVAILYKLIKNFIKEKKDGQQCDK